MHYPASFRAWHGAIGSGRAASLSSVFTRSGGRRTTAFRLSLTSLPAQNRLQSVNTSISGSYKIFNLPDLGFPLLIAGFARFSGLHLGFRLMTNRIRRRVTGFCVSDFFYRCRYPFGVRVTSAVSGCVVACGHYSFCIIFLSSTGRRLSPNYGLF